MCVAGEGGGRWRESSAPWVELSCDWMAVVMLDCSERMEETAATVELSCAVSVLASRTSPSAVPRCCAAPCSAAAAVPASAGACTCADGGWCVRARVGESG